MVPGKVTTLDHEQKDNSVVVSGCRIISDSGWSCCFKVPRRHSV